MERKRERGGREKESWKNWQRTHEKNQVICHLNASHVSNDVQTEPTEREGKRERGKREGELERERRRGRESEQADSQLWRAAKAATHHAKYHNEIFAACGKYPTHTHRAGNGAGMQRGRQILLNKIMKLFSKSWWFSTKKKKTNTKNKSKSKGKTTTNGCTLKV